MVVIDFSSHLLLLHVIVSMLAANVTSIANMAGGGSGVGGLGSSRPRKGMFRTVSQLYKVVHITRHRVITDGVTQSSTSLLMHPACNDLFSTQCMRLPFVIPITASDPGCISRCYV